MRRTTYLLTLVLILTAGLHGQEPEPQQGSEAQGPQAVSSIAQPRLEGGGVERNFLVPRLSFYQVYDSRPQYGLSPGDGYDVFSNLTGSLTLQRLARTRSFNAAYNGGLIVSDRTGRHAHFHEATLTQEFTGRRASFLLSNAFRYTPASEFGLQGFGGFGGISLPALSGLRPDLRPNQGLLTTPSSQYSNSLGGELTYLAGPRTSATVSGSYGLLRFREAGFFDVDQYGFGAGLNRQVSRRNTLSVSYSGQFLQVADGTDILSHAIQAGFGRQISGRVRFDVSAGPQVSRLKFIIPGFDRTTVGTSARAALNYSTGRSRLAASYSRGVTGGAGVLAGARSDAVDFRVQTQLTRMWAANGTLGYIRTTGLRGSFGGGTSYDALVGGAGISRPLGRSYDIFVNYRWYHQVTTAVSGADLNRQTVTLGFSWNPRQIRLDR